MADRLVELQDDIRKQERQVMFGRIAAGLVHDLSHPIQNIGNSCKLILKMWEDAEYRETFRRMVEREMQIVKRVLEDLQNIAKPIPLERFPIELNRSVGEAIESMQPLAETAGITLQAELTTEPLLRRGGRLRARARLPQPRGQRDPGDGARRPGRRRGRRRRATASRSASTTPAAASPRTACRRSSRTS